MPANRKVCGLHHFGFLILNFGIGESGSLREQGGVYLSRPLGAVKLCRWHNEIAAVAAVILSLWLSDIALLVQSSDG